MASRATNSNSPFDSARCVATPQRRAQGLQLRRAGVFGCVVQFVGPASLVTLLEVVRNGLQDGHILRAILRHDVQIVRQAWIAGQSVDDRPDGDAAL